MSKKAKAKQGKQNPNAESKASKKSKPVEPKQHPGVRLGIEEIPLKAIELRGNVRRSAEEKPKDIAASFRAEGGETDGQLQEIGVELVQADPRRYVLIYGHQRLRAAELEKWTRIRATVWDLQGRDPIFKQLAENQKRSNIGPIEEAEAFQYLMEKRGMKQAQIAREYGCHRSHVYQRLELLRDLSSDVQKLVGNGERQLSGSKALKLTQLPEDEQEKVAKSAISQGWTVRRIEREVKTIKQQRVTLKQEQTDQPTELVIPKPVQLPHLRLRAELTPLEIQKLSLWALLRNGNDQEILDYLEDHYISWDQLWTYVGKMNADEVAATLEFVVRRYAEAAHRFSSIDPTLKTTLGANPAEYSLAFPRQSSTPAMPVPAELDELSLPVGGIGKGSE